MQPEEIKKLKSEVERLTREVSRLSSELKSHTHSGEDGSNKFFQNSIRLNPGSSFIVGNTSLDGATQVIEEGTIYIASVNAGRDAKSSGIQSKIEDTSILQMEHRNWSNNTTKDSLITGIRTPYYTGQCSVTSGSPTLTQSTFAWETDALVGSGDGAFVIVFDTDNPGQFDGWEITANGANTLTVSSNFTFTDESALFVIFQPIYLGFSTTPFRRLYVMDGSPGGIRFGLGDTNGGQNGLLYMDGQDLKWRKPDGTVTTVTVS